MISIFDLAHFTSDSPISVDGICNTSRKEHFDWKKSLKKPPQQSGKIFKKVDFAAENVAELAIVQLVGRVVTDYDDDDGRRRHGLLFAVLAEGGVGRSVPAVEEEEAGGEETARTEVFLAAPHVFPAASKPQTLNTIESLLLQGALATWNPIVGSFSKSMKPTKLPFPR